MHSADYAVARCLSVHLSHAGIDSKVIHILKVFSPSPSPTILVFQYQMRCQYSDGDPLTRASNASGYEKNHDFPPISRFISKLMLDRAIVTMEGKQKSTPEWYQFQWVCVASILDFKVAILSNCSLLNGAIFSDFEQLLIQLSRSRHSLTLNISETVRGTDTVTTKY